MPEPETENPPLDAEDWEIVFEVYAGNHDLAIILAQHLSKLRDYVNHEPKEAIAGLDRAIDSLYQHSDFASVGRDLFRAAVEGTLTLEQERRVEQLSAEIRS